MAEVDVDIFSAHLKNVYSSLGSINTMDLTGNIGHMYLQAAAQHRDVSAFVLDQSRVSYGMMEELVFSFALRLRERGIDQSSLVAISTGHFSVAVAAHQAIALLGASWVNATREALANEAFPITQLLHDGTKPMPSAINVIEIDPSWAKMPETVMASGQISFSGHASDDDIWMYAQSSGTTGIPKLIPLSYGLVRNRLECIINLNELRSKKVAASPPPLSQPGVFGALGAGLSGGTLVATHDPRVWAAEGVTAIVGTPLQHMKRLKGAPIPERKFKTINVGGAKASPKFIDFVSQYAERVFIGYGSTETGPVCRNEVKKGQNFDDLGKPHDFVQVEAVDEQERPVDTGSEGTIRIKSPFMADRYIYSQESTRSAFRNGWFYPGDTGVFDERGHLTITGRINDQVSIGGVKVNAVMIDNVTEQVPGVKEAMAFTLDIEGVGMESLVLMLCLEIGTDATNIANKVRKACRDKISSSLVPSAVYIVNEIPKSDRGKPLRKSGAAIVEGLEPV